MNDYLYPSNRVSEGVTIRSSTMYEQYFDGRKPSENQVIQAIKRGLKEGHVQFEISWGENMVTLEKGRAGPNQWHGWGWIKNISGHELAEQFNREGA
jgi:hypothetical protein